MNSCNRKEITVSSHCFCFVAPVIAHSTVSWANRRLGTVGPVLNNLNVKLLDPATHLEVAAGQAGEVRIASEMRGEERKWKNYLSIRYSIFSILYGVEYRLVRKTFFSI